MKTRSHIRLVEAFMLFAGLAFSGCGSSGDDTAGANGSGGSDTAGSPNADDNNLYASGLGEIARKNRDGSSAEPRVGYPLHVWTGIEAAETAKNVSVSYYLLDKSDLNEVEQGATPTADFPRSYFLDTVTFPTVEPSVTEYLAELTVRPEVEYSPDGYVLQYIIDPGEWFVDQTDPLEGWVAEEHQPFDDPEDNTNSGEVLLAPIGNPNLFIEELTLDENSSSLFLYNEDNNPFTDDDDVRSDIVEEVLDEIDSDAGGTLIVGLEGSREPLDATVFVYLRITRDDRPPSQNTLDVPMYLWDSVAQKYVNAYGGPPNNQGAPEGLLIGTLSPQMVAPAEDGVLDVLPDGDVPEAYVPDGGAVPDATKIPVNSEEFEDLETTDRTSVHLDLYYPGGLAKVMWDIVEPLPTEEPPPPEDDCDPMTDFCVFIAADEPPRVRPPDITEDAIRDLQAFFEGATKRIWTCRESDGTDTGRGCACNDPEEQDKGNCASSDCNPEETCKMTVPECCTGMRFSIVAKVVCGASDFGQLVDDNLDDNEAEVPVELVLMGDAFRPPAADEPITNFGEGTTGGFQGKNFSVGFTFNSGASLDERGAIAFVEGSVPVKIFKSPEFDFMSLDARAQVLTVPPGECQDGNGAGTGVECFCDDPTDHDGDCESLTCDDSETCMTVSCTNTEADPHLCDSGVFLDLNFVRPLSVIPIPFSEEVRVPEYRTIYMIEEPAPVYTYPGEDGDDNQGTDGDGETSPPAHCPGNDKDGDDVLNDYDDPENPTPACHPDDPQMDPPPTRCNNKLDEGEDECPDECGTRPNGCPDPDVPCVPTGCPAAQGLSFSRGVTYNQTFFVGPVPFTASAGVGGTIGFELYASIQPLGLATKAGPFANLSATVTGAIGIKILRAGFGGTLTLIDERFRVNVTKRLAFFNESGRTGFEAHLNMSVINTLTGPAGELFLFADYPVIKWCTGWFGNQFPCGIPTIRYKLTLARFVSFVKEDVLFDQKLCKRRTFRDFGNPETGEAFWSGCNP